ncbi:helix-turn-helix transcriptional regulator [Kutzneria sp. 744]|uniref:ArsR/SmtB family transcription factor n=1 Tax=Kutzneria sp. (strain 744) TaxID=345341 RepID=UPI0003EEAA35|nr:helix-turn-helix domain-containing protein [Kutzneria sp. 744]EWM11216.1 regulatory protein [Kutzneria sp. 744]
MALRLHFTADDLARTRIISHPHPTWELVNSLHIVQTGHTVSQHALWRESSLARLNRHPDARRHLELLTALVPPRGSFPDFLTPHEEADDFAASLDAVLSTPASRLAVEVAPSYLMRQPPAVTRELAAGDLDALHALGDAMSWYHDLVLAPHWSGIDRAVRGDRTVRTEDVAASGIEGLLGNLAECIRWAPPVLHAKYPRDHDIELAGRGLTLIPSYFCHDTPVAFIDAELPPVLVYPITEVPTPAADLAALASLIGDTRARVLHALRVPRSTTKLAEHIHASPAAASKHATVLRQAGLISSTRRGNTVRHFVTALGEQLLDTRHEQTASGLLLASASGRRRWA